MDYEWIQLIIFNLYRSISIVGSFLTDFSKHLLNLSVWFNYFDCKSIKSIRENLEWKYGWVFQKYWITTAVFVYTICGCIRFGMKLNYSAFYLNNFDGLNEVTYSSFLSIVLPELNLDWKLVFFVGYILKNISGSLSKIPCVEVWSIVLSCCTYCKAYTLHSTPVQCQHSPVPALAHQCRHSPVPALAHQCRHSKVPALAHQCQH